jgi:nucleotide-binding universal stress UspA family protein
MAPFATTTTSTRETSREPAVPILPDRGDHPAQLLIDYAHRHGFDMIVYDQHRSRRAGRLLLHGVADDPVRAAREPVLVVDEEPE